ncbi:MAG: hypothetical protein XD69_0567 [Clostridia bacterium 62_21]|nr:MAG: hypothetical protein XD69_0567 [Clostridia bacterium 62_21]HAG07118.1 hypothetical protein [Peptococcaceae bacterium]
MQDRADRARGQDVEVPDKVLDAVRRAAPEGRISCPRARALAGELGVPARVVGRAADVLGVKIYGCELGCF